MTQFKCRVLAALVAILCTGCAGNPAPVTAVPSTSALTMPAIVVPTSLPMSQAGATTTRAATVFAHLAPTPSAAALTATMTPSEPSGHQRPATSQPSQFVPLATATPTFVVDLTPSAPGASSYHLRAWTAAEADGLVALVHRWLDAISQQEQYQSLLGGDLYHHQFAVANVAEDEALLRFPNATLVTDWRWAHAHDAAVAAGSSDAALQNYAQLMMDGLNSGLVTPDTLSAWFSQHEAEIAVTVTPLPPPQGYQASDMIEAVSPDCAECKLGAHWWLVEKDGRYAVQGIDSALYWYTESGGSFEAVDLTGDGYPELVLSQYLAHMVGYTTSEGVYDLTQVPARPMTVLNQDGSPALLGALGETGLAALDSAADGPGFVFTATVGDTYEDVCRPLAVESFHWTGEKFIQTQVAYVIDQESDNLDQPICQFIKDRVTTSDEIAALIPTMEGGRPLSVDQVKDEIVFRLAEYDARVGRAEAALALFHQEAEHPYAASDNPYAAAAQAILQNYRAANDFYRACLSVSVCSQSAALEQLARGLYASVYPQSLDALRQAGVSMQVAGRFDFTGYDSQEFWFVTQFPGQAQPEFWVLAHVQAGAQALRVGKVGLLPPMLAHRSGSGLPYIVSLNGQTLFVVAKSDDGTFATIRFFSPASTRSGSQRSAADQAWSDFGSTASQLLSGGSPSQALADFARLEPVLTANCQYRSCDELDYLLGVGNELMQNEPAAVAAYLKLWKTFPDSPYTLMARAKLEAAP